MSLIVRTIQVVFKGTGRIAAAEDSREWPLLIRSLSRPGLLSRSECSTEEI